MTDDGTLGVAGVPSKAIGWAEIATKARDDGSPLVVEHDFVQDRARRSRSAPTCRSSRSTCETGPGRPVRHVAVDDCGRILNPMLVDGQVHGGLASGIAQALWEQMVYDEDGNPLTSTLAEYGIPSAAEFPPFEVAHTETPSPLNPLGAKGIGESATVGSTPAVQNAVVDALSHLGVRHVDMPCTPERVWRAIEDARAGTLADPWREPPGRVRDAPGAAHAPSRRTPRSTRSTSNHPLPPNMRRQRRTIRLLRRRFGRCAGRRSAGTISGP